MTTTDMQAILQDAMRVIAESADEIKAGCAIDDEWPDAEDKAEYDRRVAVLERVRALSGQSAGVPEGRKLVPIEPTAWRPGSETPSVKEGKAQEFIIAVRRAQSKPPGKVFVFAANYANNFTDDGSLSGRDGGDLTAHGWYLCGLDTSGEFNEVYEPVGLNEGDEIVGWQELPKWQEDRAAAPQAEAVQGVAKLSIDELALIREEAVRITDDWSERQLMEPTRKETDAKFVSEILRLSAPSPDREQVGEDGLYLTRMEWFGKGFDAGRREGNASPSRPDAQADKSGAATTPDAIRSLQRLEAACDQRAALLTPEAYFAAEKAPGMREALYELDMARREACEVLARAAAPQAAAQGVPAIPVELSGVKDAIETGDGFWRSCSGCHETNEGAETGHYPYSQILDCYLGAGCSECGGIGAVWDDTDYGAMADAMMASTNAVPSPDREQGDDHE